MLLHLPNALLVLIVPWAKLAVSQQATVELAMILILKLMLASVHLDMVGLLAIFALSILILLEGPTVRALIVLPTHSPLLVLRVLQPAASALMVRPRIPPVDCVLAVQLVKNLLLIACLA